MILCFISLAISYFILLYGTVLTNMLVYFLLIIIVSAEMWRQRKLEFHLFCPVY